MNPLISEYFSFNVNLISSLELFLNKNARKILNQIIGNERKINEYVKNLLEEYVKDDDKS